MYCPRCGQELERVNGVWTCTRGNMPLSPHLSAELTDVYLRKIRNAEFRPTTFKWGGVWYCPGCGVPLQERDGLMMCPQCGQSLNEFLFDLLELHPHKEVAS